MWKQLLVKRRTTERSSVCIIDASWRSDGHTAAPTRRRRRVNSGEDHPSFSGRSFYKSGGPVGVESRRQQRRSRSSTKAPRFSSCDSVSSLLVTTFPPQTQIPCGRAATARRSEEHTSELQSLRHLVCRLLLEKKKKKK